MQPESLHPIGNQKRPSLVTELSANPIGNQKPGFLVTDFGSTESGGASPLPVIAGPDRQSPPDAPALNINFLWHIPEVNLVHLGRIHQTYLFHNIEGCLHIITLMVCLLFGTSLEQTKTT